MIQSIFKTRKEPSPVAHKHRWRLVEAGTYKTTMRERGGAGNTKFAEIDMPLWQRICQCGEKQELRNGAWEGRDLTRYAKLKTTAQS